MEYKSVLNEASELVNGDRQKQYGDPIKNWEETADIASAITGRSLSPQTCIMVLIAAKLARARFKYKRDTLVDICGYIEILNRVEEDRAEDRLEDRLEMEKEEHKL